MKKSMLIIGTFVILLCAISSWAGSFTATYPMAASRYGHTATLLTNGKVLLAGGDGVNTAEVYDPAIGSLTVTAGNMTSVRYRHTATLLPNGKVLISGGINGSSYLNSAEVYDPATGTFAATSGNMTSVRYFHTGTLLPNGKVLIAGGYNSVGSLLNTAELYDPATGIFSATSGNMTSGRVDPTATLLPNGKVLLAGGGVNTAEVYDPTTETFTATSGNMTSIRRYHTATLLPNGKVLITGGWNGSYLNTAEVYDVAAGTFTTTGNMTSARHQHAATLLPSGMVLISGGANSAITWNTAEMYDPTTGTFITVVGNMTSARMAHTATLLSNGSVLIAGGGWNTAEVYDYTFGTFTAMAGNMSNQRHGHTATQLANGKILVAGGWSVSTVLQGSDLYDSFTGTFSATGSMVQARYNHTATLLTDGKVLIVGGYGFGGYQSGAELYNPITGTYSPTGGLTTGRYGQTATLLPNGKVLITGGMTSAGGTNSAELYDPTSGKFTVTGAMRSIRVGHQAVLLPDGRVLIMGGYNPSVSNSPYNTAELYDSATGVFTVANNMNHARKQFAAVLLPNGLVFLSGGINENMMTDNTAELYNPITGIFSLTGNMLLGRSDHFATVLLTGKVLICGSNSGTTSVEQYDPALGIFSSTGSMSTARTMFTSVLLTDGKVLNAGGWAGSDLSSAELYDPGLDFSDTWRPVVNSISSPIIKGQSLTLNGSGFSGYGNAEGSGGATNNSATNFPLAQLKRIDSGQTLWLQTTPATAGFTPTTLTTTPVDSNFPSGPALLTVFVNGIPSVSSYVTLISSNKPVAAFTASPNPAGCSQLVSFDGSASYHPNPFQSIVSYAWDFDDDGQIDATGPIVSYAYTHFGTYTAKLIVTDNNIPANTDSKTIIVSVNQGNRAPVVNLDAGAPYYVKRGGGMMLDASFSDDPDAACGDRIVTYSWDVNGDMIFDDFVTSTATISLTNAQLLTIRGFPNNWTVGLQYTFRVKVTDSFGASRIGSSFYTVVNDDIPPTTTAVSAFGTWINSGTAIVTLSASDGTGSGIASRYPKYCVDATNTCTPDISYVGAFNVSCVSDAACTQYVRYQSADKVGNAETIKSAVVLQDLQKPVTTPSPAGGTFNSSQSVTLSCSDNAGSGCAGITYCTGAGCTPTTPYTGGIAIDSSTSLNFYSIDLAGNIEPVKTEIYTIASAFVTLTQTVVNTAGIPVAGAQVAVVGNPSLSAITDANGTFVLPLPYGVNFAYSISATGYRVFYSGNFIFTSSTVLPNRTIYTDAEVMGWGVNPGYGALTGRAVDASTSQTINNPTVTAASTLNPGTFYTVQYNSACGTGSGTCSYKIINIAANDAVLLTVSAPAYITLQTQLNPLPADAVGNAYVTLLSASTVFYDLSMTMTGSARGKITFSPGYSCSDSCKQQYASGMAVALTPASVPDVTFDGWTGCDAVNGTTCTVSMTNARSITASFTRQSLGTGTVYGRVTDSSGAGVPNALVRMIREYDSTSCSGSSCLNVSTDSNGSYLIGNLVPGTYITAFYNQPVGGVWTMNQYYNQKHSVASADLVSVSESSSIQIDVVYPLFGQISGTVTDTNGTGIGNAVVRVYTLDDEIIDLAFTDSTGYYTVQHVPSGTYKVRFPAQNMVTQIAYVTVTAPDSTIGINTTLRTGRMISGGLTDRNGSPIASASVTVFDLSGNNISSASTDASGAYSARGILPGTYVVLFKGPSGTINGALDATKLYSRQYYGGSADVSGATIVTVTADVDVANIDGVLEANGPAVSVASRKDFGVEVVGMSSYRSFTLTNSGTADLSVDTLSKTGDDFLLLNDRCSGVTLAPLKVCTFQVAFVPQSEGSKAGAINIQSNDPNVPVFTISLTGSGAAATGNSGTAAVPYGDNVVATPTPEVALAFNSVISGQGQVTAAAVTTLASPAPANFRMLNGASYDITTTAAYSGPITVCIAYDPATMTNPSNAQNLKLFHLVGSAWQDITTSVDTATHTICGVTASLSPFAVAESTNVYTITATADANGSITPSGTLTMSSGGSATFAITPDPGYEVQSVIVDGSNMGAQTSYTFTNIQANHTIAAYFKMITYTITASAGSGGSISSPGVNTVNPGSSKTFTITPNTGYHIADVQVDGGSVGAVSTYTFTNITANHTISAIFLPNPAYTIGASAGSSGSISPSGSVSALSGTNQSFSITPAAGYRVADVQVDGASVGALTSYTFANVQAGHTISASFALDIYSITAAADAHGSISPTGAITVNKGSSQIYTVTPDTGYQVLSVIVDGANKGAITSYTFTNVQTNHTINAYFKAITYSVTAGAGTNGSITPAGTSTFNPGAGQTYSIIPNVGYHVADVTVDGASQGAIGSYAFTNIQANHSISATFEANTSYTITASTVGNGSISPSGPVSVLAGANKKFTFTPQAGYRIADVTIDGASVGVRTSYTFYSVQAVHTINVTYTLDVFTITAAADVHGSISLSGVVTVNRGASAVFTITPDAGYQVSGVIVDGAQKGAITSYTFTNVTANHTITAYFKPMTYAITASAGSGGNVTPAGTMIVTSGASQTYSITPNAGYYIVDVLVDGVSAGVVSSYAFTNTTAPHTITATFAVIGANAWDTLVWDQGYWL